MRKTPVSDYLGDRKACNLSLLMLLHLLDTIDLVRMKQINLKTKHERKVIRRVEKSTPHKESSFRTSNVADGTRSIIFQRQNSPLHDASASRYEEDYESARYSPSSPAPSSPRLFTTQMSVDGEDHQGMVGEIPKFPTDLVDQRTGELKEPLLRATIGQLIQIQAQREDG